MEPVLGNGVAGEVGCWMEACVARTLIANAGEMNGFLKPVARLLADPLRFADGALVLDAGYAPRLDAAARWRRCTVGRGRRFTDVASRSHACRSKTLVTGVIGSDTHIVGNRILSMALEKAGYKVVALGALTPAAEFVKAAVETAADAILVSSLYGQGELDCRGFRDLCIEAGLEDILIYVGGNLVVGKQTWDEVGSALRRHGLRPRLPARHPHRRRDPDPGAGLRGARAGRAAGGAVTGRQRR